MAFSAEVQRFRVSPPTPHNENTTPSPCHGGFSRFFPTPTTTPSQKRKSGGSLWEPREPSLPAPLSTKVSGRSWPLTPPTSRKTFPPTGRRIPPGRTAQSRTTPVPSFGKRLAQPCEQVRLLPRRLRISRSHHGIKLLSSISLEELFRLFHHRSLRNMLPERLVLPLSHRT